MLENHVIQTRGFHNTFDENGHVTGFQFRFRTKYYRIIPLSQFRPGDVTVDGDVFPREQVIWELYGKEYTVDELAKTGDVFWEVTEAAVVKVNKPGGLAQGYHNVSVKYGWECNYIAPERYDPVLGINFFGYEHIRRLIIV